MFYRRFLSLILFLGFALAATACTWSETTTATTGLTTSETTASRETTTDSTGTETIDTSTESFSVTFVTDAFVTVTVYPTQELTGGEVLSVASPRDGDTGEILYDGNGQVNFVLTFAEGYEAASVTAEPAASFNNLKVPSELGIAYAYRITKLTGDVTITVVSRVASGENGEYDVSQPTVITLADSATAVANDNGGVQIVGDAVTITLGGSYSIYGTLSEGGLVVDCDTDSDVTLNFFGVSITSAVTAPVDIVSANNVDLSIKTGYVNTLTDNRPATITETDDTPNACLFADADLSIKGSGVLHVNGNYNNGIGCKDDLSIQGLTLYVTAANHAVKGSDSLTVESGTLWVTAKGGDGLKTANSDVSDSGKQRGTVTILGGTITISAAEDGIDAAYDVLIENDPTISIYTTQTYATGVNEGVSASADTLYLRVSGSLFSSAYRYAAYFTNAGSTSGVWADASYLTSMMERDGTYYYYSLSVPTGYSYYTLYRFTSTASDSLETYNAKTGTASLNTAYDMLVIGRSGISGSTITVSWSSYSASTQPGVPGGGTSGGADSLDYSAKGIKAANTLTINGGTILVESYDDAIHANSDTLLDTGSYGAGTVAINGGTLTLTTKDDGIHADTTLTIAGGTISVLTAYEGIEACRIVVSGGTATVVATDDGLNASTGSIASAIVVSGGSLDITVGSGDTDAIDSNGSYTQTGGFVVSRSALSGGMGGALDTDGACSITGGTFVGIGVSERVASSSGNNRSTGMFSLSVTGATWTVKDASGTVLFTYTTSSSYTYSMMWISSDQLKSGTTYTLAKNGTTVKTWTQS